MEIIVPKIDVSALTVEPETIRLRDRYIENAKEIRLILNEEDQIAAVGALRDLKALRTSTEATRKSVKAPVLDVGKRIDALAASVIDPLTGEETRLNQLVTAYQRKLRDDAAELERRRQAEEARITRERIAQEEEIERRRIAAENAIKAAERIGDTKKAEEAAAEATKLQELSDKAALDREMAEMDQDQVAIASQTSGVTVREPWDFEIMSIESFARNYPDLVTFTIKRREVLEAIKSGVFDKTLDAGMRPIATDYVLSENVVRTAPGLRIFKAFKASAK